MSYVWGVVFSKDIGVEKILCSNGVCFVLVVYVFLVLVIVNMYCVNLMVFLVQEFFIFFIIGIYDEKVSVYNKDWFLYCWVCQGYWYI